MSTETEHNITDMIRQASLQPSEDSLDHILNILDRMHRLDLETNAKVQEFAKTVEALKPKGSP